MAITDTACRQAKAAEKPYKIPAGDGLYLVNQAGKYWRWDYRYLGKRKTLSLGVYPTIGVAKALERHRVARKLLAEDTDPGEAKKSAKHAKRLAAENSFKSVAQKWLAM